MMGATADKAGRAGDTAAKEALIASQATCPPDRAELGAHSWQLVRAARLTCLLAFHHETLLPCISQLHSMAAHFPDKPSEAEQNSARAFLLALAVLYPCKHCAAHLSEYLDEHPPQ